MHAFSAKTREADPLSEGLTGLSFHSLRIKNLKVFVEINIFFIYFATQSTFYRKSTKKSISDEGNI
jgi:hypothetical protein